MTTPSESAVIAAAREIHEDVLQLVSHLDTDPLPFKWCGMLDQVLAALDTEQVEPVKVSKKMIEAAKAAFEAEERAYQFEDNCWYAAIAAALKVKAAR